MKQYINYVRFGSKIRLCARNQRLVLMKEDEGISYMTLFQLLIVAIIQGLTEFLPISSSGHLALLPQVTGTQDQGLAIDVAVHVGTLLAVIIYFWQDVQVELSASFAWHEEKLILKARFSLFV